MANNSLNLTSLDIDSLKQNYKNYLSNQSVFKDYNFDGSNISVLLDVISYNTYLNSFYLNMVASEMFLDSAQKLDSVISHAKELNYTPRSAASSEATISFDIVVTGSNGFITIPKGTIFTGSNANGSFNFVTEQAGVYASSNTTFNIANLSIYEGTYITETFIVDQSVENQQFVLSNQNIDVNSLTITVTENGVNTDFQQVSTLFDLTPQSNVYFIQAAQNLQYEIVFGDGLLGRYPTNFSTITASYRIASGPVGDGVTTFSCAQDIGILNGFGSAIIGTVTTVANSSSGALQESIESIRFSAPRYFATQQRAVASDDYSALVLDNFGGQIQDVAVFGGETLTPPQYGRVVVSLKPIYGTVVPDYLKNQINNFLLRYVSLPTRVIITDPDYLYCQIITNVQYDTTKTTNTTTQIIANILNSILTYNTNNLGKFGLDFRYSKLVAAIDGADPSITSNETNVQLIKRLTPLLNYPTSYTINFNNTLRVEESVAGYVPGGKFYDEPVITSTAFTYVDSAGKQYPQSYIRDDNKGGIVIYTYINNTFTILNSAIGTVDYATGLLKINNLNTAEYGNYISVYASTLMRDIIINKTKILTIDPSDISITVEPTIK